MSKKPDKSGHETTNALAPAPPVALHEALVAFQKSLARASQLTSDVSSADAEYLLGNRTLYAIDSLDVEVSAGVSVAAQKADLKFHPDFVMVDFNAPKEQRSSFRFRVESKPIEPVEGENIVLSRTKPLKETLPENHFTLWITDELSKPKVGHEVLLLFFAEGDEKEELVKEYKTDFLGKITFSINPEKNTLLVTGKGRKEEQLKLDFSQNWYLMAKTFFGAESNKKIEAKSTIFPILRKGNQ